MRLAALRSSDAMPKPDMRTAPSRGWACGSLGAFNAIEHQELTLPYLRPALDSLSFIQANRRIFFLGSWLGAFLNGQSNEAALAIVRKYLADHPKLPVDLRQKVLQNTDEIERTVRIRRGAGTSNRQGIASEYPARKLRTATRVVRSLTRAHIDGKLTQRNQCSRNRQGVDD